MSKWISVIDEMPANEQRVWIYDEVENLVTDAKFDYIDGAFCDDFGCWPDVTHWMPYVTPEPPEEE